jgi:hypothetical protein
MKYRLRIGNVSGKMSQIWSYDTLDYAALRRLDNYALLFTVLRTEHPNKDKYRKSKATNICIEAGTSARK